MPDHPLAEVFGFPPDNQSEEAKRYRESRLCPFGNKVPNCTKDKANAPLGVCSIHENSSIAITCPIRFREKWLIIDDAASFFFPPEANWTSLTEVRLNDVNGDYAGNIDIILVSYDDRGKILDFGSLEIQAVYISGNIRRPFEYYMEHPEDRGNMNWRGETNYPRADYLSSSRKRLVPQLIYKGGILQAWEKKSAVALTQSFFDRLPSLDAVGEADGEVAWLIYDLERDEASNVFHLVKKDKIFTRFKDSLDRVSSANPGEISGFTSVLQDKLDEVLENHEENPPNAPTLDELL